MGKKLNVRTVCITCTYTVLLYITHLCCNPGGCLLLFTLFPLLCGWSWVLSCRPLRKLLTLSSFFPGWLTDHCMHPPFPLHTFTADNAATKYNPKHQRHAQIKSRIASQSWDIILVSVDRQDFSLFSVLIRLLSYQLSYHKLTEEALFHLCITFIQQWTTTIFQGFWAPKWTM